MITKIIFKKEKKKSKIGSLSEILSRGISWRVCGKIFYPKITTYTEIL